MPDKKSVPLQSTGNLNILLVDDAAIILERMVEVLSEVQSIREVQTAVNGSEAIELVKRNLPDVVLLDINLPGTNGIEVLRYIKQQHPFIIVIMLTNHAKEEYRSACALMGADCFVDKTTEFEIIPLLLEEISKSHFNIRNSKCAAL